MCCLSKHVCFICQVVTSAVCSIGQKKNKNTLHSNYWFDKRNWSEMCSRKLNLTMGGKNLKQSVVLDYSFQLLHWLKLSATKQRLLVKITFFLLLPFHAHYPGWASCQKWSKMFSNRNPPLLCCVLVLTFHVAPHSAANDLNAPNPLWKISLPFFLHCLLAVIIISVIRGSVLCTCCPVKGPLCMLPRLPPNPIFHTS